MRLDVVLSEKIGSRNKASELIKKGKIIVNNLPVTKPSFNVSENDKIEITEISKYVGRGGYKLEEAVRVFGIDLNEKICIDIGSSTGGFTQCMLLNNAKKVYAVDVGSEQLHSSLRCDTRVVSVENTDIRNWQAPEQADFCSIDVSFISLKLILPVAAAMKIPQIIALIKPQFEVGKKFLTKHGIVKNEKIIKQTIADIEKLSEELGYIPKGIIKSPITGKDGNVEYLLYITH